MKDVHKSAFMKGAIIKGSRWFYANYGYASRMMKDVYRKYKQFLAISRKQRKFVKDNFTIEIMDEEFARIINDSVPKPVELKLPKLKLPKLEKVNG